MRRFASPNKGFAQQRSGLANFAVVRRGSERSDRPSRTQAEPPTGGEAHTDLLGEGLVLY